jgi:hypothetical protein
MVRVEPRRARLRFAQRRAFEDFESEHRALHARGREAEADVVEHDLLLQFRNIFELLAANEFAQHRGRRLRDRTAFAGKCDVLNDARRIHFEFHRNRITAKRIEILGLRRRIFKMPEVPRIAIMI